MNRGRHEGECGVSVCYYSSTLNVTEEMVFIPYNKSAGLLKADLETLSYVNGKNDLYLMVDGNIWHIGLRPRDGRGSYNRIPETSRFRFHRPAKPHSCGFHSAPADRRCPVPAGL